VSWNKKVILRLIAFRFIGHVSDLCFTGSANSTSFRFSKMSCDEYFGSSGVSLCGRTGMKRRQPPYNISQIVGDQQCTGTIDGQAHGPPARLVIRIEKPVVGLDSAAQAA
jgi:hypothetical protein